MTYRERRLARAERLRGWAEKRTQHATATLNSKPEPRHDWAFITQPGHIPERARMNAADDRARDSLRKADNMESRADGIEHAADRAIYMDDTDATDRLKAKIATLEASRDRTKRINMAVRAYKRTHPQAEPEKVLALMAEDGTIDRKEALSLARSYALQPYHGLGYPAYHLTNLGATIRKEKARLLEAERVKVEGQPWRYYHASKYPETCLACQQPVETGTAIVYRRGTDEVQHDACYEKATKPPASEPEPPSGQSPCVSRE